VTVRATFRAGPVGTGRYLLGHQGSWSDPQDLEVWVLLLFLPLIPVARWRVAAAAESEGQSKERLTLLLHSKSRVAVRSAVWRIARSAGVAALALVPLAFSAWTVGTPWASSLLTSLLGAVLGAGLLGKVGMAIELTVLLAGAAIPILLLMHLDETTPRVPLRLAPPCEEREDRLTNAKPTGAR
jgi:hypothetical protein